MVRKIEGLVLYKILATDVSVALGLEPIVIDEMNIEVDRVVDDKLFMAIFRNRKNEALDLLLRKGVVNNLSRVAGEYSITFNRFCNKEDLVSALVEMRHAHFGREQIIRLMDALGANGGYGSQIARIKVYRLSLGCLRELKRMDFHLILGDQNKADLDRSVKRAFYEKDLSSISCAELTESMKSILYRLDPKTFKIRHLVEFVKNLESYEMPTEDIAGVFQEKMLSGPKTFKDLLDSLDRALMAVYNAYVNDVVSLFLDDVCDSSDYDTSLSSERAKTDLSLVLSDDLLQEFVAVNVPANGHCLFYAALWGVQLNNLLDDPSLTGIADVRNLVVNELETGRFDDFIEAQLTQAIQGRDGDAIQGYSGRLFYRLRMYRDKLRQPRVNPQVFNEMMTYVHGAGISDYKTGMRSVSRLDRTYGGSIELTILSEILGVHIVVLEKDNAPIGIGDERNSTVYLLREGMHYKVLVKKPEDDFSRLIDIDSESEPSDPLDDSRFLRKRKMLDHGRSDGSISDFEEVSSRPELRLSEQPPKSKRLRLRVKSKDYIEQAEIHRPTLADIRNERDNDVEYYDDGSILFVPFVVANAVRAYERQGSVSRLDSLTCALMEEFLDPNARVWGLDRVSSFDAQADGRDDLVPADVNRATTYTALHAIAREGARGSLRVAELINAIDLLVQAEADVDALDSDGGTPLMDAVDYSFADVAVSLLTYQAKVNVIRRSDGCSALHYAARNPDSTLYRNLLESNADMTVYNQKGFTPLHEAVKSNHYRFLLLASNYDSFDTELDTRFNSSENTDGLTLLLLAVYERSLESAEVLIRDLGADINALDSEDSSAMHYAISAIDVPMVAMLMKYNPDLLIRDDSGRTPRRLVRHMLMEARQEQNEDETHKLEQIYEYLRSR
jgi:ankyrin repeat protein